MGASPRLDLTERKAWLGPEPKSDTDISDQQLNAHKARHPLEYLFLLIHSDEKEQRLLLERQLTMSADTLSLAGKTAIVTGSGRENGIGAGIVRALGRNGASVTINCVSDAIVPRAEAFAESLRAEGQKAAVAQADISSFEGAKKLVDETLKAFDCEKIDILGETSLYNLWASADSASQQCWGARIWPHAGGKRREHR